MSLQRLSVSIPLTDASIDPESIVPVFHGWIRENTVDGLLIDVARYGHVPGGPGIVLIGHEGDYALDLAGGRPWLRYTLKRDNEGTPQELVARALARLDAAAAAAGSAGIGTDPKEVVIQVYDRLRAPNTAETAAALTPQVVAAIAQARGKEPTVMGGGEGDPRAPFAVNLSLR